VPVLFEPLDVAADTASRDNDVLGLDCEGCPGRGIDAPNSCHAAVRRHEILHVMTEAQVEPLGMAVRAEVADERFRQALTGAPHHVEARHRVARPVESALDPVDDGDELHAALAEPSIHVRRTAVDVLLGPAARPRIARLELGERGPVLQGQVGRILRAHPPLLRRVDEENAAERPSRESPKLIGSVAVEQAHALIVLYEFEGCNDTGDSSAHNGRVALDGFRHASGRLCELKNTSVSTEK